MDHDERNRDFATVKASLIFVAAVFGNVIAQRTLNVVNFLLGVFRLAVLARNVFEAVPLLKRSP